MAKNNAYWYNISTTRAGNKVPTDWTASEWTKLDLDHKMSKICELATKYTKLSKVGFDGVVESHCPVTNSTSYLAAFSGGLNGKGNWVQYMADITKILIVLGNATVITIDNDACDDIWYLVVEFHKPNLA